MGAVDPWGLVDLKLFNDREVISKYADKVPDNPNVFTIGGHGNPSLIQDADGKSLTPAELAKLIKANPKYKTGMDVALLSCETGQGKDSFAQKLADELGSGTVSAPIELLWYYSDGTLKSMGSKPGTLADTIIQDPTKPGKILIFTPVKK